MNFEKIKPLGDQVIVKLLAKATETRSGIITPDMKSRDHHFDYKHREGEVLATGTRVTEVAVGEVVVFPGTAGKWLDPELGDTSLYRAINQKDILAVLEREIV